MKKGLTPLSVFLTVILLSCQADADRKIKLSSGDSIPSTIKHTASSVLQVLPRDQRSIAILLFKNDTGEPSLDWLRRGLTDMLTTDLGQSPYLNIINANRFTEIVRQNGLTDSTWSDLSDVDKISAGANIHILMQGRYYFDKERLFIDVEMRDVNMGRNMFVRSVEGESLEKIFTMVKELSDRVRENLQGSIDGNTDYALSVGEMTSSIEAFRCFSEGLAYRDKLYHREAEQCLRDAIKYDSTFAAAYLHLAMMFADRGHTDLSFWINKTQQYNDKLSEPDRYRIQILEKGVEGNDKAVVKLLEEAVRRFPSEIEFRTSLAGYYQYYRHDLDKALEEYEIAREMDPSRKLIYNNLGYLHAERGDFTTAFKYFDQYQELAPDEPNPYDSKGEILIRAGRFEEAIDVLTTAVDKWPEFYHPYARLTEVFSEIGDYNNTFYYLDKLADIPNDAKYKYEYFSQKGAYLWRFGKYTEAAKMFEKEILESPSSVPVLTIASLMYASTGKTEALHRLQQNAFDWYRRNISTVIQNTDQFVNVLFFLLESQIPKKEFISFLENIETPTNHDDAVLKDLVLMLALNRDGQHDRAQQILDQNSSKFVQLIFDNAPPNWTNWKYVYEVNEISSRASKNDLHPFEQLVEDATVNQRHKMAKLMEQGLARFYTQIGKSEEQRKIYQKSGIPADSVWRFIGPFPIGYFSGFNHEFPPEKKVDINVSYQLKDQQIGWITAADGFTDGYMDFTNIFKEPNWSVAYALIYVYSPDERVAQIRLGTDETCKLWLNNKNIWQHYLKRQAEIDRDLVTVLLHPGYNKVMLKVTNSYGDWGFFFRITDEKGNGLPEVTFHSYEEVEKSYAQR